MLQPARRKIPVWENVFCTEVTNWQIKNILYSKIFVVCVFTQSVSSRSGSKTPLNSLCLRSRSHIWRARLRVTVSGRLLVNRPPEQTCSKLNKFLHVVPGSSSAPGPGEKTLCDNCSRLMDITRGGGAKDGKITQGIFNTQEHTWRTHTHTTLSQTHCNKSSTLRHSAAFWSLMQPFYFEVRHVTFAPWHDSLCSLETVCVVCVVCVCVCCTMACQLNCVWETNCFGEPDSRVSQCDEKVNLVVVRRATLWLELMPTPISWDYLTSSLLCNVD